MSSSLSITINEKQIPSFGDALQLLLDESSTLFPHAVTREEKFQVFIWLHSAGIMSFRSAVTTTMRHMDVSKTTVHNWLKRIDELS